MIMIIVSEMKRDELEYPERSNNDGE